MSFFSVRNAISIGIGGVMSLFGGRGKEQAQNNLLCENGDFLVQENGDFILI
jgi:hypothetical protein